MRERLNEMIKVLIVDDSDVFRESIKECLQDQTGIAIVGLAENGDECLKFLDKNPVDLVLMDARMERDANFLLPPRYGYCLLIPT